MDLKFSVFYIKEELIMKWIFSILAVLALLVSAEFMHTAYC